MTASQTAFRRALTDPHAPVPPGLTGPGGGPAGARFDVYRNNVTVSLARALDEAFPALRRLLGPPRFRTVALDFLRAHPPRSPVLARYGAEFAAFLSASPVTEGLPYLPDVARLEQAMRQSYHAADTPTVADPAALASLPPAHLARTQLALAPALRLVPSRWPLAQIYAFALGDGPPPRMQAEDVLVMRPGFDPQPHVLPPGGAAVIRVLAAGGPLADAADAGSAAAPQHDLSDTLGLLIAGRAIVAIHPPTD